MKFIVNKIYLAKYDSEQVYALYVGKGNFKLFGESKLFEIDEFEHIDETPIL